jgi:hypothetical protein
LAKLARITYHKVNECVTVLARQGQGGAMAETRRFELVDTLLLAVVVAAALATRAAYLLLLADAGRSGGPLLVQESPYLDPDGGSNETAALVDNLQNEGTFACRAPFAAEKERTAHLAPGYPSLVALVGRLTEPERRDSFVRWLQAVLGVLTAGLCFLFLRRAFQSRTAALLGGLLAAWHPFWVIATATLEDGVACSFLLILTMFLGTRASQTSGPLASLLLGLTLAALSLVRAALLPFSFVAVCWFLLRCRSRPHGWLCAMLAFLGFVIGLVPWGVRNYQLLAEPVPVVDSAYLHLWIGNHPHATGGPPGHDSRQDAPVKELAAIKHQGRRYEHLGRLALDEVRGNPVATVQRRMRAGLYYLLGARWFEDGRLAAPTSEAEELSAAADNGIALGLHITLVALLVLAALGWRWSYAWHEQRRPLSLALLWLPFPYVLAHAGALSGPRLPFDGVLICYAALALAGLIPGAGRSLREGPEPEAGQEPA